jgi:hypothetical protein
MTTNEDFHNDLLAASRCLEHDKDCSGPVEFHTVGRSTLAWPRCEHHAAARWEQYESSIEQYADSDVAPSWFDPDIAGETWNDD